ncbi:MAG: hypothetical protein IPO09_17580 [Anaeromyxobacter sp.]|nr:hypothetical protein [Anaeromyxobacter sp.]MBL0276489.1 hypothetical protein [Anaeromyxobacter sp.]
MGSFFEVLLEGLSLVVMDVICGVFWAAFTSAYPSKNDSNRKLAGLSWAAAVVVGGAAGLGSLSVAPARLSHGPALVALTWIAFPLAGGLALKATTRLQRVELRAPGIAFLGGVLFALAYLTMRMAASG